jgi:hypothetical protein
VLSNSTLSPFTPADTFLAISVGNSVRTILLLPAMACKIFYWYKFIIPKCLLINNLIYSTFIKQKKKERNNTYFLTTSAAPALPD